MLNLHNSHSFCAFCLLEAETEPPETRGRTTNQQRLTLPGSSAAARWQNRACRSGSRRWPRRRWSGSVSSGSSQSECPFCPDQLAEKNRDSSNKSEPFGSEPTEPNCRSSPQQKDTASSQPSCMWPVSEQTRFNVKQNQSQKQGEVFKFMKLLNPSWTFSSWF